MLNSASLSVRPSDTKAEKKYRDREERDERERRLLLGVTILMFSIIEGVTTSSQLYNLGYIIFQTNRKWLKMVTTNFHHHTLKFYD
jgi:hypothetical protein